MHSCCLEITKYTWNIFYSNYLVFANDWVMDSMEQLCVYHAQDSGTQCVYSHLEICFSSLFNSLAPARFDWSLGQVIFKQILLTDGWGIFCETTLRWISLDLTDDKSTLVDPDPWRHMASLDHNESTHWCQVALIYISCHLLYSRCLIL